MTPDPPVLLTASEVAALFQVDPQTIRAWARAGLLPTIPLPNGHWRFRREDIERMLTPTEVATTERGVA